MKTVYVHDRTASFSCSNSNRGQCCWWPSETFMGRSKKQKNPKNKNPTSYIRTSTQLWLNAPKKKKKKKERNGNDKSVLDVTGRSLPNRDSENVSWEMSLMKPPETSRAACFSVDVDYVWVAVGRRAYVEIGQSKWGIMACEPLAPSRDAREPRQWKEGIKINRDWYMHREVSKRHHERNKSSFILLVCFRLPCFWRPVQLRCCYLFFIFFIREVLMSNMFIFVFVVSRVVALHRVM